ncbi:hypothetical protein [Sulfobacillus harzensis]|uniref:Uncharacterized protein n=1 Tax=Sulfobacillus harzensis TaxID=2729629 RepID=A0A7Y0Q239_9FIRM|nr:hypothetical protein [Sulfobacillus harzensis]NMP21511.1 hypothetical protein [Sulfobacillus harzensis]
MTTGVKKAWIGTGVAILAGMAGAFGILGHGYADAATIAGAAPIKTAHSMVLKPSTVHGIRLGSVTDQVENADETALQAVGGGHVAAVQRA